MSTLALREAESSDFEWLLALEQARRPEPAGDPARQRERFVQAFSDPDLRVIEAEGEAIGSATVRWDRDPVEIADVAIDPAHRGRGWGTRLLHRVITRARASDRDVAAEVAAQDPVATWLSRLGFTEVERGEDRVWLRWSASAAARRALRAALEPWTDPERRDAWLHDLFASPPEAPIELLRFVASRHGLTERLGVLDLACGTGRRLDRLAALGWRATGLEARPSLLAAAQRRAARSGAAVRSGGVLELGDEAAYDLVVAVDGAWSWLTTPAERDRAAHNVGRALRPGGLLVIETPNTPRVLRNYREPTPATLSVDDVVVSRIPDHDFDFHRATLTHRDTFVVERDGEILLEAEHRHTIALVGLPEIAAGLERAGLGRIETFTDLDATARGRCIGRRIVLTARAG